MIRWFFGEQINIAMQRFFKSRNIIFQGIPTTTTNIKNLILKSQQYISMNMLPIFVPVLSLLLSISI